MPYRTAFIRYLSPFLSNSCAVLSYDPRQTRQRIHGIVVTQIAFDAEEFSDIEAGVRAFGEEIKDEEDALMFLPGRTEREL